VLAHHRRVVAHGSGALETAAVARHHVPSQRPYMIDGNPARSVALFRILMRALATIKFSEIASKVNLSDVWTRGQHLDRVMDWVNVLSIGEQQRVAFARFCCELQVCVPRRGHQRLDEDNQERFIQLL